MIQRYRPPFRLPAPRAILGLTVLLAAWAGSAVVARAESASSKAVIIPIGREITDITVESVKRRIEQALEQQADVLVFELDTPGGLVTSSIAIADAIKNLSGVKTVAWVNPNAHSGGAIVAVACEEIVMARSSRIGDSQVIMGGPTGVGAVPEDLQPKAYTPVLAEFRASAKLRGYDQVLCEAFVLPQREVWWLENTRTGQRKFAFQDEKARLLGEESEPKPTEDDAEPAEKGETTPAAEEDVGAERTWRLVEKYHDSLLDMDVEVAQPIVPADQLLEMSAGEAQAYGFSKGIVATEADLRTRYALSSILRLEPSWSETLAHWLTSIPVRGFLMLIILLGAYVEFHTPGVGVPGLVALICLAIFVGAPYLTGLANIWELLFVALGLMLLAVEIFVIPGFGVAGVAGIFLVLVGVLATFVPDEPGRRIPLYIPELPASMQALKVALITLVGSALASLLGMVVLSRFLPRTPMFRRFVPANPTPSEVSVGDPYAGAARLGDVGLAEGPLHPAGKARFGTVLVDVVTQGEYVEAQRRVEVVERRGNRVVVREAS